MTRPYRELERAGRSARRGSERWLLVAALFLPATALWWSVDRARSGRGIDGAPRPSAPEPLTPLACGLVAPDVVEPLPLRFAWPASGRVRVRAEHRRDAESARETFDLAWRTLDGGVLLVETHAHGPLGLPGPLQTGGAPLLPVQAVVAADGRLAGVPHEDELRALWDDTTGHHAEDAAPTPLAEVWPDWVERWLGLALAPGEEREVPTGNELGRATVRCERLDTESVRLVWRLARSTADGAVEHGPLAHEHERTVRAELWTDGLRPRLVTREARWTWSAERGPVRTLERASRYELDWSDAAASEAASAVPPPEIAAWSERCWPALAPEERVADERAWAELWPRLSAARREQLVAGLPELAPVPRVRWLRSWPALRRLWLAEEPLAPARTPVRTWVEHAPREAAVDVLFVGDGYAADELVPGGKYAEDVERIARGMLSEPPLAWYRDWFNVRAAYLESPRSSLLRPSGDTVATALDVRMHPEFTIGDLGRLWDIVRIAGDADLVLVLVNEPGCRGFGHRIGPSVRSVEPRAAPVFSVNGPGVVGVALHEIGHSFARLVDEYDSSRENVRVSERTEFTNALVSTFRPTPPSVPWSHFADVPGGDAVAWVHEGAYYRAKNAWRPWPYCRMRESSHPFCPVCSEALARAVFETCGLPFNDDLYHEAHPLERWRR